MPTLNRLPRSTERARGRVCISAQVDVEKMRLCAYLNEFDERSTLHDIANMSYRVELWESQADHIRRTVAASGSIVLARAAFEAATKVWPHERFTLRQGIMTIREYSERPRR